MLYAGRHRSASPTTVSRHPFRLRLSMLLQQPAESPYDLRFPLFGFPVRIAWGFWVASIIFGFEIVRAIESFLGPDSPGRLPLLILWAVCLLVSILIHELGHAFAFRMQGYESSIVLYHFGGLAIPQRSVRARELGPANEIWISLAGPLTQLMSAVVLAGVVYLAGYRLDALFWLPLPLERIPGIADGRPIDSAGLYALLVFYLLPSVFWALINLIPVLPLDGGHVARSLVFLGGGDMTQALWISVIAAGMSGLYAVSIGQPFIGIFFLVLGVSSFQALQQAGNSWR